MEDNEDRLQAAFIGLVHAFGVLRDDGTPCGQPMSVSSAHALCELADAGGINQRDLAQRLGLTTSTVSRLVDQFERRGWANRTADASGNDRRVKVIVLTDAGRRAASQVTTARAARFAELVALIDEKHREQVVASLEQLREAAVRLNDDPGRSE